MGPEHHGNGLQQGHRVPLELHRLHLVQPWNCSQAPSCHSQHLQVCLTLFMKFCFWLGAGRGLSPREDCGGLEMGYF